MPSANCKKCNRPFNFEAPEIDMLIIPRPNICIACADQEVMEANTRHRRAAEAYWRKICPPMYQDTDLKHPDMPPLEKLNQIIYWKYGPKGLLIHGHPRTGKTRLVWLLVKRLLLDGHSVAAMTAGEFSRSCAEAHGLGGYKPRDWFHSMTTRDVLYIDDLGKCKLTDRVESDLFEIVEHRGSHGRPMLVTTNLNGATLKAMLAPDRAEALYQRLTEFNKCIHL